MNLFHARLLLVVITLLFYKSASAGPLDDYYLQQFGEAKSNQLQKAVLSVPADIQESARCGMPLKKGLRRDWNLLEASTQKVLAKQLALTTLPGEITLLSSGGHFIIHYTTTSSPQVCQNKISSNYGLIFDDVPTPPFPYTLQSWVQTVGDTFEYVYGYYYNNLGYSLPPNFPATKYNVTLRSLACDGYYGVTQGDQPTSSESVHYTSFIDIDKDFTNQIFTKVTQYNPLPTYTPLQSLQVTAAHEYHHAIQYGYNYYFNSWYAEATSTWMEDELFDSVNQLYSYIPTWFAQSRLSLDIPEDTTTGGGYGRWIFNRYLAEQHTTAMIRTAWEKLAPLPSPDGYSDIRMVPVLDSLLSSSYGTSLGNDFFGFAKRVYQRDWTTHTSETNKIHTYSPVTTYSTYPVNSTASNPVPSVTLPHYAFAYYTFLPSSSSPHNLNITVTGTSGIKATTFIKNSVGTITEYPFPTVNGTTITIPGFSSSKEAVLLICNITDVDDHQANFSTDSFTPVVNEPTLTPNSSSSGSGCFIATAAYGSYLHPQVQKLRHFRDNHLLTNVPGRAFVTLYYRYSPPLAEFIARHAFLRGMTRMFLTPIIIAVIHPVTSVATLLFAVILLYRPLRRRYLERIVV